MNRIPTEGLKLPIITTILMRSLRLNEQNPDRGIETTSAIGRIGRVNRLE